MKINRFMIAAPKSGSGKTMITCAMLQILQDMGKPVYSYKCGPDYIDPMFHKKVLNVPSKNLDTFFTDEEMTRQLFFSGRQPGDFAVLEGVMGLYDGLGGIYEQGSSYHLAKVTQTPIILVVDAKGMGKSVLALIAGFLQYDTDHLIRGIVLNRMSKGYYEILKPVLERELPVRVAGYFPEQKDCRLESRHLGLVMPDELDGIQEQITELAGRLRETIDMDAILAIAEEAEEGSGIRKEQEQVREKYPCKIAVAMDEAFCFYYEDNLRLLEEYGAVLQYFSPLQDKSLPKDCDGILLGGGYPELYAKELSGNHSMRKAVRSAFESSMPTVAECGGFLYLHTILNDRKNQEYEMAGVLNGTCQDMGRLVRFGYIELEEKCSNFLPEHTKIRAHEFHYFDSSDNGSDCIATKPVTGRSYPCILSKDAYWLGFPHLYYPSNPAFAKSFVRKAHAYQKAQIKE